MTERSEAAFAILEYNLERYPDNQQTFVTMAQIHQAMGNRDALIATLERAVEALPENQFFRQTLQRLRRN